MTKYNFTINLAAKTVSALKSLPEDLDILSLEFPQTKIHMKQALELQQQLEALERKLLILQAARDIIANYLNATSGKH